MAVIIPSHVHGTHTGEGQSGGFVCTTHPNDERYCCRSGAPSQVFDLGTELMLLLCYLDAQLTLLTKTL